MTPSTKRRFAKHGVTAAAVVVAMLVSSCSGAPRFEAPNDVCPFLERARAARGGVNSEATEEAVSRLLTVMPEDYHDEIALWYYPVGGSVEGLDTSGVAAEEAGELLEDLYKATC